jgi:hypothetical protein
MNYFINEEGLTEDDTTNFIRRFTLTKMRASRGVQVFLETESTSKMSQALGHEKYNPNLLSHYLPEPILDFFQSRWIRLFQKGIICEAMKDSNFLLQASGFKTMEQLELFLKNHTLKNLPEKDLDIKKDSNVNTSDIYININDEIISTLISIDGAVENSNKKEKITSEALYWSNFSKN